jgi:pilus assembly protein Flp/PilA
VRSVTRATPGAAHRKREEILSAEVEPTFSPSGGQWALTTVAKIRSKPVRPPRSAGPTRKVFMLASFIREENGVTAIEYGLIAALIAVAIIIALTSLGQSLESNFNDIGSALDKAI